MAIRPVTPGDAAEWARLRHALWPEADPDELVREVDDYFAGGGRGSSWLLAEAAFVCEGAGDTLCGLVEASIRPYVDGCDTDRVGYIEGWYVDPAARRRGVGGALIAAAEAWARAQGCTEMASDVLLDNAVSHLAHGRLGYGEVERIVIYRKPLA